MRFLFFLLMVSASTFAQEKTERKACLQGFQLEDGKCVRHERRSCTTSGHCNKCGYGYRFGKYKYHCGYSYHSNCNGHKIITLDEYGNEVASSSCKT